jgi:hypothetical protein
VPRRAGAAGRRVNREASACGEGGCDACRLAPAKRQCVEVQGQRLTCCHCCSSISLGCLGDLIAAAKARREAIEPGWLESLTARDVVGRWACAPCRLRRRYREPALPVPLLRRRLQRRLDRPEDASSPSWETSVRLPAGTVTVKIVRLQRGVAFTRGEVQGLGLDQKSAAPFPLLSGLDLPDGEIPGRYCVAISAIFGTALS